MRDDGRGKPRSIHESERRAGNFIDPIWYLVSQVLPSEDTAIVSLSDMEMLEEGKKEPSWKATNVKDCSTSEAS